MASPPTSPPRRPRRESRFTEGSYTTSSPTSSPTSPSYLSTILSEQDSYEAGLRRRGNSNSSSDSLESSTSPTYGSSPTKESGLPRRSITFGRQGRESGDGNARRSLDERPRGEVGIGGVGGVKSMVKGRLRALTGERKRDRDVGVKPYPGT